MTVYDVLRLHGTSSLTRVEIARSVDVSTGTVSNILARAREAGVSWPTDLDPAAMHEALYPPADRGRDAYLEPDLDTLVKQLEAPRRRRTARVTRQVLWEEYCEEAARQGLKAYSRSRFFDLVKARLGGRRQTPEMRFHYRPGEWMMSDFSGKTVPVRTRHGEVMVEILVCLLPCSGLIFAVAVPDQTLASWTEAHRAAFAYMGGVAERLVCDNLRSAVTRWCEGEAELNPTFADFARHYGIAVLPARPRQARDKGAVEASVKAVQTRILARLRTESFFSIADLNQALRTGSDRLNDEEMKAYGTSRRHRFEETEAPALRTLPAQSWTFTTFARRRVGPNYHITFEYNHYSLPSRWIGREVMVKATCALISIHLFETDELLVRHARLSGRSRYQTTPGHMPSQHREMAARQSPNYEQWLLDSLAKVGPYTVQWAESCLRSKDFREQGFRTLRGVVRLSETHTPAALENACKQALGQERFTCGRIKDLLDRPLPAAAEPIEEVLPVHEHIRGSSYYSTATEKRS